MSNVHVIHSNQAASIRSLDSEIGSVVVRLLFAKYVVNGGMSLSPIANPVANLPNQDPTGTE